MNHDDRQPNAATSYRFLHSTLEELAQLLLEKLLQVALEERTPLQIFTDIWSHLR